MIEFNGWCDEAIRIDSPNFDERPAAQEPEVLIIHSISLPPGKYGGNDVEKLFTNQLDHQADPYYSLLHGLKVSCHFFIRRDGQLLQFVATDKRAWHCGVSSCLGRSRVNDFSVGVELEGVDFGEFEPAQYKTLVRLTFWLQKQYPKITKQNVLGHQHIAPERKADPGCGFDWVYYFNLLWQKICN